MHLLEYIFGHTLLFEFHQQCYISFYMWSQVVMHYALGFVIFF
uniref:Uncharacterized protein n=1 Tax=Rhizophora mucronata TaxID=61149 RepID=A0A2P2NXB4_RHIMU